MLPGVRAHAGAPRLSGARLRALPLYGGGAAGAQSRSTEGVHQQDSTQRLRARWGTKPCPPSPSSAKATDDALFRASGCRPGAGRKNSRPGGHGHGRAWADRAGHGLAQARPWSGAGGEATSQWEARRGTALRRRGGANGPGTLIR
ncbi:hypothetical protein ZWY2020_040580 [Hordeum vulgare]|nr:hypothetical protein ZWY2020_040580 [Hordeum vulgare]